MKKFVFLILLLSACQYHPPARYLRRCGFFLYNGSSPHSNSYDQWLLQDSNFYYQDKFEPIKYFLYFPSLNIWNVGVGWGDNVLGGIQLEINSRREFKKVFQDFVNPDSLGLYKQTKHINK
jgi:hypothetical protein